MTDKEIIRSVALYVVSYSALTSQGGDYHIFVYLDNIIATINVSTKQLYDLQVEIIKEIMRYKCVKSVDLYWEMFSHFDITIKNDYCKKRDDCHCAVYLTGGIEND